MYNFRSLKSQYSIIIRYRLPDYNAYEYSSKMVLNARQNKDNYLFTLEEKLDTWLNNEIPSKIMDFLMMQLGDSLYPMQLMVSAEGKLLSVLNFEKIKKNWEEKSSELLRDNFTLEFKKYIEISQRNFSGEERFREVLLRDSFIQIFFMEYGNKILELNCDNFPVQSKKTTYYAKKVSDSDYTLVPAFQEKDIEGAGGDLNFQSMSTGELSKVEAYFYLVTESGVYDKRVIIEADPKKHKAKTGLFF